MRPDAPPGSWRLFAPALVVWGCAAVAVQLPGAGRIISCSVAACGAATLLCALQRRAPRLRETGATLLRFGAVGCAALIVLGAQIEASERVRADPALAAIADSGSTAEIDVRLRGFVQVQTSEGEPRAWAEAVVEARSGAVPVVLWMRDGSWERTLSPWAPGARLRIDGEAVRLEPGSAAAYGIRVGDARPASPVRGDVVAALGAHAAALRAGLADAAGRVRGAELVPGFAVGDTSLVGPQLDERMRQSSLTHLVAVSGANCALVTGAAVWIASLAGAGRRLRLLVAAAVLGAFVFVVGPDASVQRAAVMAVVVLASRFGGRRAVALPALGAAVLALLLVNPWQALQPGFALSVAATAGILLLVPAVERAMRRLVPAPRWVVLPVAVAASAQFACGPLLLLLQPGIPAVGVLANVLAGPAAPLGTGLGLLALLLLPLSAVLGDLATRAASLPARWVAATAEVTAGLPLARWEWPEGWSGAALLAAAQALLVGCWLLASGRLRLPEDRAAGRAPWRESVPLSVRGRTIAAVLGCAGLGIFSGPVAVAPLVVRVGAPHDWSIVACDVGQGDALLLRDPGRPQEVMLVDTGDDVDMLRRCLDRFDVRRISLLVLTHDDRDHVGALEAVAGIAERALIAPENLSDGPDRPLLRRLAAAGLPFSEGAAGSSGGNPGMRWEVLAPSGLRDPPDTNAASLVLRVQAGEVPVLLLADTGEEEQRALRASGADLSAAVTKVAHHGSRDQDAELPRAVGAEYALVSVGADNGYGHPTAEALDAHARAGARQLRTDEHGSIAIGGSPGELRVWVERGMHEAGHDR